MEEAANASRVLHSKMLRAKWANEKDKLHWMLISDTNERHAGQQNRDWDQYDGNCVLNSKHETTQDTKRWAASRLQASSLSLVYKSRESREDREEGRLLFLIIKWISLCFFCFISVYFGRDHQQAEAAKDEKWWDPRNSCQEEGLHAVDFILFAISFAASSLHNCLYFRLTKKDADTYAEATSFTSTSTRLNASRNGRLGKSDKTRCDSHELLKRDWGWVVVRCETGGCTLKINIRQTKKRR